MNNTPGRDGALLSQDRYREAGRSKNTHDAYLNAVNHYRDSWGGLLPASPGAVASYLTEHASQLKVSTLRLRLAGLSKWHVSQGFSDPTKAAQVQDVMRGIARIHNVASSQATPLEYRHLTVMCNALEEKKRLAIHAGAGSAELLSIHRNLALLLLGFWQAFRSDELSRVRAQDISFDGRTGMTVYIPSSKTDVELAGRTVHQPFLKLYCPVEAVRAWLDLSGITRGPIFRKVERSGALATRGLHKRSIELIIREVASGLFPDEPHFTAHSLRRGFAHWAIDHNWDEKTVMDHVGWKSVESARRYMPTRKNYGDLHMEPPAGLLDLDSRSIAGAGKETLLGEYQVEEKD